MPFHTSPPAQRTGMNGTFHKAAADHQLPSSPQHHTTTFSHKIRHMFDTSKYAIFLANVTIHELGNVPQLEGEFAVRWKFRGHRPRGKEGVANKPSLPNLQANRLTSTLHPSTSSLSLRSSSTSTTSTSSPVTTTHPSSSRIRHQHSNTQPSLLLKANSLPPDAMAPIPARQPSARGVEKKASDPTPLRQSISPNSMIIPTDSPEMMEEPIEVIDLADSGTNRAKESLENGSHGDNRSLLPPVDDYGSEHNASTSSSQSHLGVGLPSRKLQHPPARSGTYPSPSSLMDPLGMKSEDNVPFPRPKPMSRTSSAISATKNLGHKASSSTMSSLNTVGRSRDISGAGASLSSLLPSGPASSPHRKGTTPGRHLKLHTCTWDYTVQHPLRIPLGKPVAPSQPLSNLGPAKPRPSQAPVLGAGPLSESGIRLMVKQLPTSAVASSHPATGAIQESNGAMTQVHNRADREKGYPLESGKASRRSTEEDKPMFGMVDVDLAAFAGKGRTTRRFLLKGSKTNATIKVSHRYVKQIDGIQLTVELRWIGGEESWMAPPMQEGHHVTRMQDIIGTDAQEKIRNDLNLNKTPSDSSGSEPSIRLASAASSADVSRNVSSASLAAPAGPAPNLGYKSFEHHLLKPNDAQPASHSRKVSERKVNERKEKPSHRMSPVKLFRSNHQHHSHHIRDREDDLATPISGIHELPPEVIIEAVFNPHPATEEGPFTFVPAIKTQGLDLEGTVMDEVMTSADASTAEEANGKDLKPGWGSRMRARRDRRERERQARITA